MSTTTTDIAATLRTLNNLLTSVNAIVNHLADTLDHPDAPDPLHTYSLKEAAQLSGIPRRTLNECLIDHRLPGIDLGTGGRANWRIKRADLERFINLYYQGQR